MKPIPFIFLVLALSGFGYAQESTINEMRLSEAQIDSVVTDNLRLENGIQFPITRVYEYHDKLGKHLIVFTESTGSKENDAFKKFEGVFSDSIKAFFFDVTNAEIRLQWTINDFILPDGNEFSEEYAMSFWTKYLELKDLDGDGVIDPIIVYGTEGMNGHEDGRIKILVYHNRLKRAIRHQNGSLDFQRNTVVDSGFYNLPDSVQGHVKLIMQSIRDNDHGIFPRGWQESMKNKKLKFHEN